MSEFNFFHDDFELKVFVNDKESKFGSISLRNSHRTDSQVTFVIEIDKGHVLINSFSIYYRGIELESGECHRIITTDDTFTIDYNSGLIRFV